MEPFATTQDMEDRTQGEITATTHPFLEQELAAASWAIRNHCRWHVATSELLTFRRRARFASEVWLPASKISSISSAVIDGNTIDVTTIEYDEDTGWTSLYGRAVDVIYSAGHATVPEDVVTLTLELAAGALGASLGIAREQAGGVSLTYARSGGGITAADEGRLAEYRLGRLP